MYFEMLSMSMTINVLMDKFREKSDFFSRVTQI